MSVRVLDDNESANVPYFTYKIVDKKEGKKLLGCNVERKGYKPIHITLQNKTDKSYSVALSNISLPVLPPEYIARHMMKSTSSRVVGCVVGTGIIAFFGLLFGFWLNDVLVEVSEALFISGIGGATALGIGSRKANKKIRKAFSQVSFPKKAQLAPNNTLSGVIFVPKDTVVEDVVFVVQDAATGRAITLRA